MDTFEKLNSMLEKELDEIVKKGTITPEHLAAVDKVVDIMKDIKEICNMDDMENGYSQRGYSYNDGYSRGTRGARYNRGSSYSRGNNGRGGYSRHDDREDILDRLDYLMENSGTEQERQAIRQALNTLENM